ncbi:hypothetical protein E5F05_11085 [Deinococcus metallilatus]|uniref:Uncharacterized protein n=1 Tax=Deinococcus metallilatus TaxID=1211322 RepID=A0AAJ5F356_9DEIO|nr:hypothetical protein [Deinococcus metallilatus]MBB5296538.1 hypothetical protein [Deinococcus metallilatus]QBY08434.1 hypothetical protein E5F05_11085 [Deinococcus metallilatus]RXJ11233.1 hypothetical protein ERJ73_09905 [Deinococcus metallilatus]TLK24724.1 hypothetical protein FCS05_14340 [Deinococcus metallilatus]GMA17456.1 hypothetical protein GCM10025871_37870 [Deinococcus metallilatus]
MASDDLPSIKSTAQHEVPDFQLSPLDGIVSLRVSQIMEGQLPGLTLSEADLNLYAPVQDMVDRAYRAGLRDGLVRLGELVE